MRLKVNFASFFRNWRYCTLSYCFSNANCSVFSSFLYRTGISIWLTLKYSLVLSVMEVLFWKIWATMFLIIWTMIKQTSVTVLHPSSCSMLISLAISRQLPFRLVSNLVQKIQYGHHKSRMNMTGCWRSFGLVLPNQIFIRYIERFYNFFIRLNIETYDAAPPSHFSLKFARNLCYKVSHLSFKRLESASCTFQFNLLFLRYVEIHPINSCWQFLFSWQGIIAFRSPIQLDGHFQIYI